MINSDQIRAISQIQAICRHSFKTQSYIWGGWIPDIYSGKILRQHADGDLLVVNLYEIRSAFAERVRQEGWTTQLLANDDLRIRKAEIKLHLGHVVIQDSLAIWFHNGDKGQITFPKSWLNDKVINFLNLQLFAVRPEFQYVLKMHPKYLNSKWERRIVDDEDLEILKRLIRNSDVDIDVIDRQMRAKLLITTSGVSC